MKDIKTIVKGFIIGPITVHNEGNCIIMVSSSNITSFYVNTSMIRDNKISMISNF